MNIKIKYIFIYTNNICIFYHLILQTREQFLKYVVNKLAMRDFRKTKQKKV